MNENKLSKFYSLFTVQFKKFFYVFLVILLTFTDSEWIQLSIMLATELFCVLMLIFLRSTLQPIVLWIESTNEVSLLTLIMMQLTSLPSIPMLTHRHSVHRHYGGQPLPRPEPPNLLSNK
jgi:hypothetical protein